MGRSGMGPRDLHETTPCHAWWGLRGDGTDVARLRRLQSSTAIQDHQRTYMCAYHSTVPFLQPKLELIIPPPSL